jgi:UDP-N-acetylglucosamine transferase subunit ALG13
MIFVTVGSCEYPFDRLLDAVGELPGDERVVVQSGSSELALPRAECFDFVPFEALVEYVRSARLVVTHAGIGSILTALGTGKRPVVVPRRRQYGEAVDDHQVGSARRLAEVGLVTYVDDPASLGAFLADGVPEAAPVIDGKNNELVDELHEYLHAAVDRAAAGAPSVD